MRRSLSRQPWGLGVEAVEPRADVLPAGGDEDGPAGVEDGEHHAGGGGQPVAGALQAHEVDELRQLVRPVVHAPPPASARYAGAGVGRPHVRRSRRRACGSGRVRVARSVKKNVAPLVHGSLRPDAPPWRCTMRCTVARPMPVPSNSSGRCRRWKAPNSLSA